MYFVKEPCQLTNEELIKEITSLGYDVWYLEEGYALDCQKGSQAYCQYLSDNSSAISDRLAELQKEQKLRGIEVVDYPLSSFHA